MKWIDIPPVWLLGFILLAYWISTFDIIYLKIPLLDAICIFAGFAAIGAAVFEMTKHRTTVIPHREADALVRSGIFAVSRNPIYLGDVLVLIGLILYFRAPIALVLVPLFVLIIRKRFILPEEQRLAAKFGTAFDDYYAATRRWF